MKTKIHRVFAGYYRFDKIDWTVFIIGSLMILDLFTITILEWHFKSIETYTKYKEIYGVLQQSNNESIKQISIDLAPNATILFWGGSTYWFTFMTNAYLAVVLTLFPFYRTRKKAHVFFYASVVYITITMSMYWLSVLMNPIEFTIMTFFEKIKSCIVHIVTPILGIFCLIIYRKILRIDNNNIWILMIFPAFYYLFTLTIYFIGYKFIEFGGSEIQRGVVIYTMVSFYHPLGYQGDSIFIIVIFNIILFLMALLTAPIYGFIYRRILRIRKTGQRELPKIIFRIKKKNNPKKIN